jgi:hypothetical protein
MATEKDKQSETPSADAKTTAKKAPEKKSSAAGYVVAEGRAISAGGRIIGPGESISAAEVADIEALVKGGYVVKA